MAGLRGVKILLLWAGIIGLAKSQTPTVPDNAPTASPTTNHTKGPSPLTSPEDYWLNTTVDNTTPVRRSTAPPLECNYTVKTIKFGLQIDITSSAVNPVPTSIMIHEEGKPQTAARFSAPHSNPSSSHKIKQLKPCTKYEFNVILDDKDRRTPCERMTVNDNMTDPIMKEDIEEANCSSTSSKSVCYQSGWDISSLQTTPDMIPDLQCGNNTVCFKPGSDDICSIMTFNFSSKTCTSTSFQLDRNIKIRDFLDVKNINQTAPTQFPVKFETKLPPNCNLSIDYTCHSYYPELHGFNKAKNLSELEPFMDYKCIGLIKDKNNVTVYNTTEVKVRIDCDLKIVFTNTSTTNTSSQLTWTTTINRCKDVIQKLLFHCRCGDSYQRVWSSNQPSGGTCNITDLKPYRVSTCWVQPYYNYRRVGNSSSVKQKTEIGVPEDIDNLKLEVKDHNTIIVTCNHSQIFNGPEGVFKAQLHHGGSSVERNDETCEFEFKNLEYSTKYTVKVTAANSLFESNPVTEQISTEYMNKTGIVFYFFLTLLTFVSLLMVVSKIYDLSCGKYHPKRKSGLLKVPPPDSVEEMNPENPACVYETLSSEKTNQDSCCLMEKPGDTGEETPPNLTSTRPLPSTQTSPLHLGASEQEATVQKLSVLEKDVQELQKLLGRDTKKSRGSKAAPASREVGCQMEMTELCLIQPPGPHAAGPGSRSGAWTEGAARAEQTQEGEN
ncbi:receptor-type tyrosine-protein phosphatase C isoform X2 [Pleuronectes platessa]|uniref:receptor-type tyrosine-protein phosphatase C isoform X2 n=1 Tax=Pleuronectes platessa TaxID=8262 RepID=UPI00232A4F47|nr:receptor-type tyrosine-protein phosphatase C isoform X2 [Pleuronectes platessa]